MLPSQSYSTDFTDVTLLASEDNEDPDDDPDDHDDLGDHSERSQKERQFVIKFCLSCVCPISGFQVTAKSYFH